MVGGKGAYNDDDNGDTNSGSDSSKDEDAGIVHRAVRDKIRGGQVCVCERWGDAKVSALMDV